RVRLGVTRFIEGDFADGIRHVFDDFSQSENIDLSGFRIDASLQLFVGLEILPRCDNDGILNSLDHNLWINSLFSTDLLNRLKKHIRHPNTPYRPSEVFKGRDFSSAQSNSSRAS